MKYHKYLVISCALSCCLVIIYWYALSQTSSVKRQLKQRHFSIKELNYTIYSNSCTLYKYNYVILVTSFAGNFIARDSLRRAYSSFELKRHGIVRVFLLAKLNKENQMNVLLESKSYNDIVQGDFNESYRNLTYKHLMGLQWASHCDVKYIIKMDDDIVVDIFGLMDLIETKKEEDISLMGYVIAKEKPRRDRNSKWYVSKHEYSGEYYPKFLSGWLYITNPSVARRLLSTATVEPFFWIDDVYVTGILASKAKIPHQDISSRIASFTELIDCCIKDKILCTFVAGPSNGYYAFHNMFRHWSDNCRQNLCNKLPPGVSINRHCTVKWQMPIDIGKAELKAVPL